MIIGGETLGTGVLLVVFRMRRMGTRGCSTPFLCEVNQYYRWRDIDIGVVAYVFKDLVIILVSLASERNQIHRHYFSQALPPSSLSPQPRWQLSYLSPEALDSSEKPSNMLFSMNQKAHASEGFQERSGSSPAPAMPI